jgi:hypothetical protein
MIRMNLHGRAPRLLRLEELATSVWELEQERPEDTPGGPLALEWLSPAGVVLEHRVYAGLRELAPLIPALLAEHVDG